MKFFGFLANEPVHPIHLKFIISGVHSGNDKHMVATQTNPMLTG